ncbi:MAG: gliding motility-associated C-terminal domain-containing protein [Bacteroidetes bacterium]|nr:gliding motility-associated C-terminal domain-containing protein [Bacteroidota bacterium]
MKSFRVFCLLAITATVSFYAYGQQKLVKKVTLAEYENLKANGKLQNGATYNIDSKMNVNVVQPVIHPGNKNIHIVPQTTGAPCSQFVPCDTSFQPVPFTNGTAPEYRNDDGSTTLITLPFSFCLFGQTYTDAYINNNGNVSFNQGYNTFTSQSFPVSGFTMVAPFWADVDTRDLLSGVPCFQVSPTHLIVTWNGVGYFNSHSDKLNTFQLIMTDGSDPILPIGNNVAFIYGDMQWTTGDASAGTGGFGGTPATVGANLGNGIDFIQFGRFDEPGYGYDGPFGANDSVDFLDYKTFVFNSCTGASGSTNIPPIINGLSVCDTIVICMTSTTSFSDTIPFHLDFLGPEPSQITTVHAYSTGPAIFNVINNTPGIIAHVDAELIVNNNSIGLNSVTFVATDNGTPPASDSIIAFVELDTIKLNPPNITGPNYYCTGVNGVTLSVPNIYQAYLWSDSTVGVSSIHVLTGTYNVEVTDIYGCKAKSPAFPVWEDILNPVIGGVTAMCGQDSAHLQTTQQFQHYQWFSNGNPTGDTSAVLTVGSGNYSVTISDQYGCSATSASINVQTHPSPVALFTYSPITAIANDTIHFADHSTAGNGTIVSWLWNFGDGSNSTSNMQNPSHAYTSINSYNVTLTVTQTDGCTDTYTLTYTGEPNEVIAPNIFTPNGDSLNQTFKFTNLEFFPNSKLVVLNRWGKKVFENNNYQNDWDGGDLSDGVYYYVLTIPNKDAIKGTVTIKR